MTTIDKKLSNSKGRHSPVMTTTPLDSLRSSSHRVVEKPREAARSSFAWTDAEIIEFATEFREGILDGRPSNWMCAMVCYPLVTLLGMHGLKAELVETDLGECNHVWMRLADGRALDPTADQFNVLFADNMPPVYLGPPTKYHGVTIIASKGA